MHGVVLNRAGAVLVRIPGKFYQTGTANALKISVNSLETLCTRTMERCEKMARSQLSLAICANLFAVFARCLAGEPFKDDA
jgi:hypothetical protein